MTENSKKRGLLSTGEAAKLVGASREAIRKATKRGQVRAAFTDDRGRSFYEREAVVAWAESSKRVAKRRKRPGTAKQAGTGATRLTRTQLAELLGLGNGREAADALPPAVAAVLVKEALTAGIVARYRALLERDLVLREAAVKAREDRATAAATRAATELRQAEQERNDLERSNNIRQAVARFRHDCESSLGWSEVTATVLDAPAREVLLRLDDDTVARAARGDRLLDRALVSILNKSEEWRNNLFPPVGVFPRLTGLDAIWFDVVQEELRKAGKVSSGVK